MEVSEVVFNTIERRISNMKEAIIDEIISIPKEGWYTWTNAYYLTCYQVVHKELTISISFFEDATDKKQLKIGDVEIFTSITELPILSNYFDEIKKAIDDSNKIYKLDQLINIYKQFGLNK